MHMMHMHARSQSHGMNTVRVAAFSADTYTCICFLIIKNQRDALISKIYFWNGTLHVSDSFSVDHCTVHTVIGVCHTGYVDCLLAGS
jgi:hypothetical protein